MDIAVLGFQQANTRSTAIAEGLHKALRHFKCHKMLPPNLAEAPPNGQIRSAPTVSTVSSYGVYGEPYEIFAQEQTLLENYHMVLPCTVVYHGNTMLLP